MDVAALLRSKHRGTRHGLVVGQAYTVHGHTIERITYDGKLVGNRVDGEVIACNMRHQVWLEQQLLQCPNPLSIREVSNVLG